VRRAGIIVAALLMSGCASESAPEPTPTLRAPECFDGTVENGCPSWALDVPAGKTVTHHTVEGGTVYMHYSDGTKTVVMTSTREDR
jgi:hypothetical protein